MFSRYYGVVKTRFRETFAYRFNYLATIAANFITLFIIWYIWKAVFSSTTGTISGFTFNDMISYMALAIMLNWFMSSFEEYQIEFEVKSGAIATYLIKPISYPLVSFFRDVGSRFSSIIVQILPFMIAALFFIKISLPVTLWFIPSLILGYLINYNLVFLTGMWAFVSNGHVWGMRLSRNVVSGIFAGTLIPLALFPEWLSALAKSLPFASIVHAPVSIYLGKITGAEIYSWFALQAFWLVIMSAISVLVWKRIEKRVFIQGG